jgi:hypothetical protein
MTLRKRKDANAQDEPPLLPPHGIPPPSSDYQPAPCQRCYTLTDRKQLAQYGARCFRCYEAFCREPQPRRDVGDKRVDPRNWAHALKRHEDAREPLSPCQRAMWRYAFGPRTKGDDL